MKSDLPTVLALKRVLESASEGMGMAQAVTRELSRAGPDCAESARLALLGYPLRVSLRPLTGSKSEEVSMLSSLIMSAPGSSSSLVGRSGGVLAETLERWVKTREGGKMQEKALRFRSLVTCGVLGAVTAMIASIGPLVGNLDFAGPSTGAGAGTLIYGAAGLAAISSGLLGLFMSGWRFYVNVAVTMGVFALVSALASPLSSVSPVALWGVK